MELRGSVRPFSQLSTVLRLTFSSSARRCCDQRRRSRARLILVPIAGSVAMPLMMMGNFEQVKEEPDNFTHTDYSELP